MMDLAELAAEFWGVWLMILFVGIIVWTFWPGRKRRLERHADIPLRDEPEEAEGQSPHGRAGDGDRTDARATSKDR